MRESQLVAIGSDQRTSVTDAVVSELERLGFSTVLFGALSTTNDQWPHVAKDVACEVASGRAHQGLLFCWTGTGVSIAANKIPGIRAALCSDAETARGARKWNDANILCMSLRTVSQNIAYEIIQAWLATESDQEEHDNIETLKAMDPRHLVEKTVE